MHSFSFQMRESKLYFTSIILYLYILLTFADNDETNNNVAFAKPKAKGNVSIKKITLDC